MALNFAINTAAYPGVSHVLLNTDDGLVDFKTQAVAGKVVVPPTKQRMAAKMRNYRPGKSAAPYFIES